MNTRTEAHVNYLMEQAIRKSSDSFSNELFVSTAPKTTADKFIKEGLTPSRIKLELKKLSQYALEIIVNSDNKQWSQLAKEALINY